MKTIYKILFFVLLCVSLKVSAQLDTMTYIKQFEANKAQYINQPLSKLLNDMTQIQPKTIWSMSGHKNMSTIIFSLINFCEKDESFSNPVTLSIHWQTPLSTTETEYYEKKNDYFFTNEERLYYGSKIVKDIKVYR